METIKTKFQADLSKMDLLFWKLQYSYPLNFGMPFRLNMSYFLMLLAVCMLCDEYCSGDLYTKTSLVALVLFVYAVVQWNRDIGTDMTDAVGDYKGLFKQLDEAIISAERKYSQYPDVNSYLKKIKASSKTVRRRKALTLTVFRLLFFVLFAIYGLKIYADYMERNQKGKNHTVTIVNVRSKSDYYYKALNLQKDVPFLHISPLKAETADGLILPSIDIYLHYYEMKLSTESEDENNIFRCLKMFVPKIVGGNNIIDRYHLTITDKTGKPISGCPDFVFPMKYVGRIVLSSNFPPNAYSRKYKFQALHTLKYLQAHQADLRYVVQKI